MKKVVLAIILIAAAFHLKAQALWQAKPASSFSNKLFDNHLKVKPGNGSHLLQPGLNLNQAFGDLNNKGFAFNYNGSDNALPYNCDRMPVAKLTGYDKMPIAK